MGLLGKNKDGSKKKFKDTKVGVFLKEKAPEILDQVGEFLPDKGGLGILKNIITSNQKLTPEDKEMALKYLEADIEMEREITKRWEADMNSDSWLSKNARPLVLLSAMLVLYVLMTLDSTGAVFEVKREWIDIFGSVLMTVIIAYFGARGAEKVTSMIRKTKK